MLKIFRYDQLTDHHFKGDKWVIIDSLDLFQIKELKDNKRVLVYLSTEDLINFSILEKKEIIYIHKRPDTSMLISLLIALSNIWKSQLTVYSKDSYYWRDLISNYNFNKKILN